MVYYISDTRVEGYESTNTINLEKYTLDCELYTPKRKVALEVAQLQNDLAQKINQFVATLPNYKVTPMMLNETEGKLSFETIVTVDGEMRKGFTVEICNSNK